MYAWRGRCYLAMHSYHHALQEFSAAIDCDGHSAKNYGLRAQCHRMLGHPREALKNYDEALKLDKENLSFHFERADVCIDLEKYHEAIEGFTVALERKGTEFQAYVKRGLCYRRVGNLAASIDDLKYAVAIDPTNADGHNHLGLTNAEAQDFREAKKNFHNAVELDATAGYLNNLGLSCYHLGEYDEALDHFRASLQKVPDACVYFNSGNAKCALGHHEEAVIDYAEAALLDPDPIYPHKQGLACEALGKIQDAILQYEEALQRDRFHHSSRFRLGTLCHQAGQYRRALDEFNMLPVDAALHEARGELYCDMNELTCALADFDAVIELESEAAHYYRRGVVHHRMGNEELAIRDLTSALELGHTEGRVYNDRGLAWRASGNISQAVLDFNLAIEADPTDTEFLANRAQSLFDQRLWEGAEDDLSRALRLNPTAHLLYLRGITRYTQQRYAPCIADLKASLELGACELVHAADLFYHLGVSYAVLGKHSFSVPALDQAILREPQPHFFHERAKGLQVLGEHERALVDFSRVIHMQRANARAIFRRAFSFKALGRFEEAARDFEAARELEPDNPSMIINYRKVYDVSCISLCRPGQEDQRSAEKANR